MDDERSLWHLCAPGPSMSAALMDSLRGQRVAVVGLVFELAPWAEALIANDAEWWIKYPHAHQFAGLKFSANRIQGVRRVEPGATNWSSGVLGLQALVNLGAEEIHMHGFDHHGSHYFGPYTNGLTNTPEHTRLIHLRQFQAWAKVNTHVRVVNCTPGSAIDCFPFQEAA